MDPKILVGAIKPPVHLKIGDQKVEFYSGCSVIDVTFPNVFYVEVAEIYFKNFYTAWLTVKAKKKALPGENEPKWKTCVKRFQMMPCAHADQNAETYFTISNKHMSWQLQNIQAIRLILRQPSPIWKDFKIDDMRFYKSPMNSIADMPLPKWVTEPQEESNDRTLKQVPSIPLVSKNLQQMWALTDQVADHQPTAKIGRCDVDGSYEITLLSYT